MTPPKMNLVREFMQAMKQDCPHKPDVETMDCKIRHLREQLIHEENDELCEAVNNVEALDAIADLLYVVYGAAIAYGFSTEQVDNAFEEVHGSNMTKLWTSMELREGCVIIQQNGGSWLLVSDNKPDEPDCRCWLVKNAIGKVIKSPSYRKADLEKFLNQP